MATRNSSEHFCVPCNEIDPNANVAACHAGNTENVCGPNAFLGKTFFEGVITRNCGVKMRFYADQLIIQMPVSKLIRADAILVLEEMLKKLAFRYIR